jgi:hypothetical protein
LSGLPVAPAYFASLCQFVSPAKRPHLSPA